MSSGLKIFIMGNRGYASKLLDDFIKKGEQVVGISCRNDKTSFLGFIRRVASPIRAIAGHATENFFHKDPFGGFLSPRVIAVRHKIPVLYAEQMKTQKFYEQLQALAPDVIFVAGFHRLIPENILTIPKRAIVNFHPSLLPKHRGGTPNRWVIRNGERESGVTVHAVTEKFDEGDVFFQRRIPVAPNETWGELEMKIADLVVESADATLDATSRGALYGTPQKENDATYEPPFHGRHQVIDWALSAEEIRRICYAMRPKSGGLTTFSGRTLCIWDIEPQDGMCARPPGSIIAIENRGVVVCCGKGAARVTEFLSHGKIVPAHAMVSQLRLKVGGCFV